MVLSWHDEEKRFQLSLGFDDPEEMGDRRLIWDGPIAIDPDELDKHKHDSAAYGRALTEQLFPAEKLREFYKRAKDRAAEQGIPMRVRLSIDRGAPQRIQAVRWETLHDLDVDRPIAHRTDVRLSRYLSGAGWDVLRPPRERDLRALVVIADPNDIDMVSVDPPLARIDVEGEKRRALQALRGIAVTMLVSKDGPRPTIDNIASALDDGFDILYLVCHGLSRKDGPTLYLEDEDGKTAPVAAEDLSNKIEARQNKPTLAVLCSCWSAGAGGGDASTRDDGAMAPLGPQLAEAGIAAIVAMQANITMATAATFLRTFFEELAEDGVVDRAVGVARARVSDRHDWWVPVLFTRLKRGRTYYKSGFSVTGTKLNLFAKAVKEGRCTPVLGPGLAEPIIGRRADVARDWVDRWLLPISPPDDTNITTVGQFVQTSTAGYTAHEELASYVVTRLARDERYRDVDPALFTSDGKAELLKELGKRARQEDPEEPHAVMAALGLPVYITTSWTGLLAEALEAEGREPQVQHFDWNDEIGRQPKLDAPTPERPLVYHLFGRLDQPDSMVLTEDDYFQWLAKWAEQRQDEMPRDIYDALTRRSLMFVGYRLQDWDFRVLFQSLRNFRGHEVFKKRLHVGVQVDPSAPGVEAEAAQDYVNKYFEAGGVTIFWGRTKEFLKELANLMDAL
ncbi:MAG TPA: SIR2 family protein [Solirubrobacteraceae bacterium]